MSGRRSDQFGRPARAGVGLLAFAVVFVAVFLGVKALRRDAATVAPPARYDERSRTAFLTACVQGAGSGSEPVCGCAYERLIASVPFNQYLTFEAAARQRLPATTAAPRGTPAGSNPSGTTADSLVPDALETILVDCVAYNRALGTPPGTGGGPGTPVSHPSTAPGTPGTTPPGTLSLAPA